MTSTTLLASGFVSLLAVVACGSDATPTSGGGAGAGHSGGAAPAGAGSSGAPNASAGAPSAGSSMGGAAMGGGGSSAVGGGGATAGGASGAAGTGGAAGTAGMGGTSGNGGGTGCAYKLCEDFEGMAPGTPGASFAINVDNKGTVVEDVTTKAHGGTHSEHIKVSNMAGVYGYITETKSLAATGASFWGRVFLWSEVATPDGHIVNVAVDGKSGNMDEQVRIVNVIGNHIATNRRSDDAGKGSNVTPAMGKWSCYEWHITPNDLQVYLDGTELPIAETWVEPTISLLRIGFERFTAGQAGEMWIDDVAVNDTQIGCK